MIRALIIISLIFLSACGNSPEPDYYTLAPVSGAAIADIAETIEIRRPAIPPYLDRPEFVEQENEFRIGIDSEDNWAEPLDKMLARILADDLQQRLPASHVMTEGEFVPDNIRFIVDTNIDHFNEIEDNRTVLEGELVIHDKKGPLLPIFIPLKFTASVNSSPRSMTAGLSQLVADAADKIKEQIKIQSGAAAQ
jgi:uncharacterized lipoprotein YmbA